MAGTVKPFTAQSASAVSAEFEHVRNFDPYAIIQVGAGAGNWSLKVQGRVSQQATCPLFTIATITQADLVSGTYARLVDVYPFMVYDLTVSSGTPAVNVWENT